MRGGGAEARDSAGPGSRGGPAASPSLPVLWRGGRSAGLRSLGAKGSVLHVDGPGGLGRAGPEPARVGREPESLGRAQDARRDDDERQVAERELQGCVGGQDQDFRTQAQLKGCSRLQGHHDHLHTLRAGRPRPLREESSEFSSTQGPSERPLGEGAASRQPPPRPRGKLCLATSPHPPGGGGPAQAERQLEGHLRGLAGGLEPGQQRPSGQPPESLPPTHLGCFRGPRWSRAGSSWHCGWLCPCGESGGCEVNALLPQGVLESRGREPGEPRDSAQTGRGTGGRKNRGSRPGHSRGGSCSFPEALARLLPSSPLLRESRKAPYLCGDPAPPAASVSPPSAGRGWPSCRTGRDTVRPRTQEPGVHFPHA